MEALITSLGIVAIAEIGDKTQLLSFVLAARFRGQRWRVIAGIFLATIINHLFAAYVGEWVTHSIDPRTMRWVLGVAFLCFAAWALIPDALGEKGAGITKHGAFSTTALLFFLAEMGDKTQLATMALGAKYGDVAMVAIGTTCGMMLANVPAVLIGEKLADRFPLSRVRFIAAVLFALLGILILTGVSGGTLGHAAP